MLLEREDESKGIIFKAYLHQVLEPIVFEMFDGYEEEFIYIGDGAKIHIGAAKIPKDHVWNLYNELASFTRPKSHREGLAMDKIST